MVTVKGDYHSNNPNIFYLLLKPQHMDLCLIAPIYRLIYFVSNRPTLNYKIIIIIIIIINNIIINILNIIVITFIPF